MTDNFDLIYYDDANGGHSGERDVNVPFTLITVYKKEAAISPSGNEVATGGTGVANGANQRPVTPGTATTATIMLPLPTNITDSSGQDWGQLEGLAAATARFASNVEFSDYTKLSEFASGDVLIGTIGMLAARANDAVNAGIQGRTGIGVDPIKEVFYQGVQFRNYTFQWEFAPRNVNQARQIMNAIRVIERESHPTFTNVLAFEIPRSFNVKFEHTGLPDMKRLVVKSVATDYTNSGVGPKFNVDENGENLPAFINLTINFSETEIRTSEDFA